MNILFITSGPVEWASSRIRAYWVANELRKLGHSVDVFQVPKRTETFTVHHEIVIWQKIVVLDAMRQLSNARHYYDACDPTWWWEPELIKEVAGLVDGVVASSPALADDFNQWYGQETAVCIPDRLDLTHYHTQRQHRDTSPVRFVWFGIAANRIALWAARANLERLVANGHKIELTILDERPDLPFYFSEAFPIYHAKWELSTEVDVLSSHDIALLPPYPGPWGEVKSNNKALTAWACGLPVSNGGDYKQIEYLVCSEGIRAKVAKWPEADDYDVAHSALDWERLLS